MDRAIRRSCAARAGVTPLLLLGALTLAGCSRGSLPSHVQTAAQLRVYVLAKAPAGSPVRGARRLLERHRFHCKPLRHGDFAYDAPARGPGVWKGIDYVYCDQRETSGLRPVTRRFQVALVQRGGKLVDVGVSIGLIGP